MRTIKVAFVFLMAMGMILATGYHAQAARTSETPAGDPVLDIDKTAAGTSLIGTITIYYEAGTGTGDMKFFIRLRKGYKLYGFSGVAENINYGSISSQQAAIVAFVTDTVIPYIYCCGGPYGPGGPFLNECPDPCWDPDLGGFECSDPCPPFALKNFDQFVENEEDTGPHTFTIMDIIIKVQD
ncbi:hypothetical protein ES703_105874 [subsurface metagenome]